MKKFILALVLALAPVAAFAGDIAAPTPAFPVKASAGCTLVACSGAYVGFGLSGSGTNADIIGNGINNSVFAAGGIIDIHAGYQLWNGQFFAAFEVGIGNEFQQTQSLRSLGARTLTGYEVVKLGMGLQSLFNQTGAAPVAGQAPAGINIPAQLQSALMSPYFITGAMQRNGISQWVNGAGAEFFLAKRWNLDLRYVYGAPVNSSNPFNGAPPLNLVSLGLNYHF